MPSDDTRRLLRTFGAAVTAYEDAVQQQVFAGGDAQVRGGSARARLEEVTALIDRLQRGRHSVVTPRPREVRLTGPPSGRHRPDPVSIRVHVEPPGAEKPDEGHPVGQRELDGEVRGGRDADTTGMPGDRGLLHDLEARPPADHHITESPSGTRSSRRARPMTLSTALWRPTSSRTDQEPPGRVEQGRRVKATRPLEGLLSRGERGSERVQGVERDRDVAGDGLEVRCRWHPARSCRTRRRRRT